MRSTTGAISLNGKSKMGFGMTVETIGQCVLHLGDNLEILPTITADAVVTDPPYGIGESSDSIKSRQRKSGGSSKALADQKDYGSFDWDNKPASAEQIALIRDCSKHQIIFGGNYFVLPPTSCWLVWDKQNGDNDFADCELAWTNLDKAVRRIYWRWNGMIRQGNEERFHPTQKPLEVMRWCLGHIPNAKTICDPFMGSGTTGVACVKDGRSFIGIERDERYFETACKRIETAYKQPDMFVAPVEQPKQEVLL